MTYQKSFRSNLISVMLALIFLVLAIQAIYSLPRVDGAPSDPNLYVGLFPLSYWVALFSAGIIVVLAFKRVLPVWIGVFCLIITGFLLHGITPLVYANPVWTDTYHYVSEVLYVEKFGNYGFAWSFESPALSLFGSQITLITGLDHITLASYFSTFAHLFNVLIVYVIGRRMMNSRYGLIAAFLSLSISWQMVAFNRQSFSFLLYMVLINIFVLSVLKSKRSWALSTLMILVFTSLVIAHPYTSINLLLGLTGIFIVSLMFKKRSRGVTLVAVITFGMIFLSWHTAITGSFAHAINLIPNLLQNPDFNIVSQAMEMGPTFTQQYSWIVEARQLISLFLIVTGLLISFGIVLYYLKGKTDNVKLVIGLLFVLTVIQLGYTISVNKLTWSYRPIRHAVPLWCLLVAIIPSFKKFSLNKLIIPFMAVGALFLMLIPALTYSPSPFMYAPTTSLKQDDFLSRYVVQSEILVFDQHEDQTYYLLKNNNSYIQHVKIGLQYFEEGFGYNLTEVLKEKVVVINFRAYAKDSFYYYYPSLREAIETLKLEIVDLGFYGRVYQSDEQNMVFYRG